MKIAIIADDLTGANDSGVQLAKYGLKTSVLLNQESDELNEEVVVFDTDSRAIDANEAMERVKSTSKYLGEQGYTFIFKKIDSTMRGNIGSEIKGLWEQVESDFVIVNPGYPSNGRQVINGNHYLNGKLLHETEIADDPLMPVKESYLPDLLKKQLNEEIGLITHEEIKSGPQELQKRFKEYKEQGVHYIVADAEVEEDLENLLLNTKNLDFSISWAGSAGLANYLPKYFDIDLKEMELEIKETDKPILTVIGSVNINSRNQLDHLLENEDINSIEVQSYALVSGKESQLEEVKRVYNNVIENNTNKKNTVIYTSGTTEDIQKAREAGAANGLNHNQVSKKIVNVLGELTARLINAEIYKGLVVTGGDTLKQVAEHLNVSGFQLYDELQTGVPITQFKEIPNFYCVTKAGGFGNDQIFIEANNKLKGE